MAAPCPAKLTLLVTRVPGRGPARPHALVPRFGATAAAAASPERAEAAAGTGARAQPGRGRRWRPGPGRVPERPPAPRAPTGAGARASYWSRRRRAPSHSGPRRSPSSPPRRPLRRPRLVPARVPAPPPPPAVRAAGSRAQVAGARGRAAVLPHHPAPRTPPLREPGEDGRGRGSWGRAPPPPRLLSPWLAQRRRQRSRTDAAETGRGRRRRRREGSCMHEPHR